MKEDYQIACEKCKKVINAPQELSGGFEILSYVVTETFYIPFLNKKDEVIFLCPTCVKDKVHNYGLPDSGVPNLPGNFLTIKE